MIEAGWDLGNIKERERLVLPEWTCDKAFHRIKDDPWIAQKWAPATISTKFWSNGRATLEFDNCNKEGEVTIMVDGTEIAKSKPLGGKTTAVFNVEEDSILEIKADSRAITRLLRLHLECGKQFYLTN